MLNFLKSEKNLQAMQLFHLSLHLRNITQSFLTQKSSGTIENTLQPLFERHYRSPHLNCDGSIPDAAF
jgi:hypothetical protein